MKWTRLGWTLGLGILAGVVWGAREVMAEQELEQPAFSVEKAQDGYEWRLYEPYLVAEVSLTGERSEAANQGFQLLAGYIFGANRSRQAAQKSEKIAMTSPVTQQSEAHDSWKIRFMMPKKFTLDTLPEARDRRIRFLTTRPERYLALRFSGGWGEDNLGRHRRQLLDYVASHHLAVVGEPIYAFYNAPFVPAPLRRNEVLLRLADTP